MPATSPDEQARADAYLAQLERRRVNDRAAARAMKGDDEARRELGDEWVPLRKTGG